MKFEYNGKIYNPSNLEKKLKKLRITLEDIKIIPESPKKQEKEETISDTNYKVTVKGPDNYYYISWVPKNEDPPEISKLFQSLKWNPITKTGLREITDEYIKQCIYVQETTF